MSERDSLTEGIRLLGLTPEMGAGPAAVDRLRDYLAEVTLWNRRQDLVKASGEELVVKHVLDSLGGLPIIAELPHDTIVDVGSGAGFPGIPLALFLPESRFTLLERSAKRAAFLRAAVTLLDLRERVEVLERPLEQVSGRFAVVTFRAFRELTAFAPHLFGLTAANGCVVAYKGRRRVIEEELAEIHEQIERSVVHGVSIPGMSEERTIAVIYPASRGPAGSPAG